MIAHLSRIQSEHGVRGATGEIGVHHGKLWLVLHLTTLRDETCFAIDLFDDQARNIDHSGKGDLARFKQNIGRFSVDDGNVVIWPTSSLDVKPTDIVERCGRVRLFSIDGGHTAECTYSDLALADQSIVDDGIVVLDDFFNPHWPDVATGASAYFRAEKTTLKPFAIAPGKVLLAKRAAHALYRNELKRVFGPKHCEKVGTMFDCDVDIYGIVAASRSRAYRTMLAVKQAYWQWLSSRH